MRTRILAALLGLSALAARPQERELKEALAQCAAVFEISDRLECFDSLARGVEQLPAARVSASAPGALQSRTAGEWTVDLAKDPITDTAKVTLSLIGNEHEAELVLRCRQNKPDAALSWRGRFLGATEPVVWTRFDQAKAEKKKWAFSTDHRAAFFPGDAKVFIRQLLTADRLVVQTDHFSHGTINEAFALQGLKGVIAPLNDGCRLD